MMRSEVSKWLKIKCWLLAGLVISVVVLLSLVFLRPSQAYPASIEKQPTFWELRQFVEKSDRYINNLVKLNDLLLKAEELRDKIAKARSSYEERWLKQQLSYVLYRIHWLQWDCNSANRDYTYLRRQIRYKYGF